MRFTTVIPEPDFTIGRNSFQRLARLVGPAGTYTFWWWRAHRSIIVCDPEDTFYIQPNKVVHESLADIFRCASVGLSDLRMYKNAEFAIATVSPPVGDVLDGEWADLAADRHTIRADVNILIESAPVEDTHNEPEDVVQIETVDEDYVVDRILRRRRFLDLV